MCNNCDLPVFVVDEGCPAIALSCPKCREIAIYTDADLAARASIHHVKTCDSDKMLIVELMSP